MKPTSLKEIASVIASSVNSSDMTSGVAVDTRLLHPGDLFFALPGEKADGHSFIEAAAKAGAVGAVVKMDYQGEGFGLPLIRVENVLQALQTLSKFVLEKGKASVVAITGSLGKTTTKEFAAALLKYKFKVSASPGNSNSQIGLPLAILNHTSIDDEIIILEMGMTNAGQITKLAEIAVPDVAVVTAVALVHAVYFESVADIARSKAEIFTYPHTQLGIYHLESDMENILRGSGTCKKLSFSTTDPSADFFLETIENKIKIKDTSQSIVELPLLNVAGAHNHHNFLAAVMIARYFGMSWKEIEAAQSHLELPERRLQFIEKNGVLFVDDAYNASEMSIKAALNSLPLPKPGGKRIAFLGGIVELGKFSENCHRAVGKYALGHVDLMLCFGVDCLPIYEEWTQAGRTVIWAREREELVAVLQQQLKPGDVVLLKGSRAKGVWKVLEELR